MPYVIRFKPSAVKQLAALPADARSKIGPKIEALANGPNPKGSKQLSNHHGLWRIRSGAYRVVYTEPDDDGVIRVLKVGHRKDVYRGL